MEGRGWNMSGNIHPHRLLTDTHTHTHQKNQPLLCWRVFVWHACARILMLFLPPYPIDHQLHIWIQFQPFLFVCLPLPAASELREEAGELEFASHRISLHLLPFPLRPCVSFLPTFLWSPLLFSFICRDLPLSSHHYYCIKGADGHNNSGASSPCWFPEVISSENRGLCGCDTSYNASYGGDRYTVGTLWCVT